MTNLSHLRFDYNKSGLTETDLLADPVEMFRHWLKESMTSNINEPYAMTLATSTPDGKPSARIVLLRHVDQAGFQFFTNYHSRKGHDLAENQQAAILFFWPELERQVRIEGVITRTDDKTSDTYFAQRPRESQIAAVASAQSDVIANRKVLEDQVAQLTAKLEGKPVPRPPHWGGYTLKPDSIEFWQGRTSRLHDRLRYRRENNNWIIERLSP